MKALHSALPLALALGAVLLTAAVTPAKAGLGDQAASVEADRVSMKGQLRTRSEPGYSVQEITASNGALVREYVSPSGVVFAVSWSGRTKPNLQQTLGTYFTQFVTGAKARRSAGRHSGHNHLEIHEPSLVVHAGGHMRQYFGFAYVPSLVPRNLSVAELQ